MGAGPGLCGLAAAALGAQEATAASMLDAGRTSVDIFVVLKVDLSDRCKAVQEALKMSAEESTNPHLLSKNGLAKKENGFKNATVRSLDWEVLLCNTAFNGAVQLIRSGSKAYRRQMCLIATTWLWPARQTKRMQDTEGDMMVSGKTSLVAR